MAMRCGQTDKITVKHAVYMPFHETIRTVNRRHMEVNSVIILHHPALGDFWCALVNLSTINSRKHYKNYGN